LLNVVVLAAGVIAATGVIIATGVIPVPAKAGAGMTVNKFTHKRIKPCMQLN
jgi:hypothetical protein